MTVHGIMIDQNTDEEFVTNPTDQIDCLLMWESRGKWYNVSQIRITHNPEYPTPAINVVAPNPGIRFTVEDTDGNVLYTNVKPKEKE